MSPLLAPSEFRRQIEAELLGDILPFWLKHAVDHSRGGFYGALTNERRVVPDAPKAAILCARILWTYAAAYRLFGGEEYRQMAGRAYAYLNDFFIDREYGGVYWWLKPDGRPLNPRKQVYAQAFAIYGLSEYYRATGLSESLTQAQTLFHLIEKYAADERYGGYVEAADRRWQVGGDMRLSEREPNCVKSMNTLLHVMEAYTNLLRVWDAPALRARQRALIEDVFLGQVIDPRTHHFRLFFDAAWNSLGHEISYGHDIEGSWLLVEAAEAAGDAALLARARAAGLAMAQAVYAEGLEPAGSLAEPLRPDQSEATREWWPSAEGVVGFYNAYQLSGAPHFHEAAQRCWQYIQTRLIDRQHGEWFKEVRRDGTPVAERNKVGPWECPYHNGRMGYEMLARLAE